MVAGPDEALLRAVLARVQAMLLTEPVAEETVEQLARTAQFLLPHASGASASMLEADGSSISTAATTRVAADADAAQFELDDGPALDTWATRTLEHLADAATDTRWPAFSRAMAGLGVSSALCVPLVSGGETRGVVKVYAAAPNAFTSDDETTLVLLATAAAALLPPHPHAPSALSAALQATVRAQQVVDLATGILMERHQLDPARARRLLTETAMTTGQDPAELARALLGSPNTHPQGEQGL